MKVDRKVTTVLTLLTISLGYADASIASSQLNLKKPGQYITAKCQFEDKIHPILGTMAKSGLKSGPINRSVFIELINYRPPACSQIWRRDFYKVEMDTAAKCCSTAKGMTKTQVETLLGQPAVIANTQMLDESVIPRELWLYRFGGNNIPLGLTFERNKCVQAVTCDKIKAVQMRLSRYYPIAPAIHPILKILPGPTASLRSFEMPVFRKLKDGFVLADVDNWRKLYGTAEKEAAKQFCKKVAGRSKADVITLVGQPFYKGGSVHGWSCAKPNQDIWLYTFGRTNVLVRLIFDTDKCIKSELYAQPDDLIYQRWRENELATFSIGKTIKEIIDHEGIPTGATDESQGSAVGDSSMYFASAPSSGVIILLVGGKCTKTQLSQISQ
jgi:hypothetical protein